MTIDLAILLASIAVVESNTNDAAIGAAGERGRYQLTKEVWEQWMPFPPWSPHHCSFASRDHDGAYDPALSRWVAERHIKFTIIPELEKAGRQVTVWAIACCWNAGITGHIEHDRGDQYAYRVVDEYARGEK